MSVYCVYRTHPFGLGIPLYLEGGAGRQRRDIIGGRWKDGKGREENSIKEKEKETKSK